MRNGAGMGAPAMRKGLSGILEAVGWRPWGGWELAGVRLLDESESRGAGRVEKDGRGWDGRDRDASLA